MVFLTSTIFASTASLTNLRLSTGGRRLENVCSAVINRGSAAATEIAVGDCRNSLRVDITLRFSRITGHCRVVAHAFSVLWRHSCLHRFRMSTRRSTLHGKPRARPWPQRTFHFEDSDAIL